MTYVRSMCCSWLFAAAVLGAACGLGGGDTSLSELQRVQAGDLEVVLLSAHDAVRQGRHTFVLEFRSRSDGRLVDVGDVRAGATMAMPGMAPMAGPVDVRPTAVAGRYEGTSELSMAGAWLIALDWRGPAGEGSATLSVSAQ